MTEHIITGKIKPAINVGYMRVLLLLLAFSSCQNEKFSKSNEHDKVMVGELSTGATVSLQQNSDNNWSISVENAASSSLIQPEPVQIELYQDSTSIIKEASGYENIHTIDNGFTGTASVKINDVVFNVTDSWTISGKVMQLSRELQVEGSSPGGFLSTIIFHNNQSVKDVRYFAPGMIYGNRDNITRAAIGGHEGGSATWIREDRLPAPLFGVYSKDGTSITILDPSPQGHTTKRDSRDRQVTTLIDGRFRFGAIGAEAYDGAVNMGFKWPGTEGETTYRGYHYPGGQAHKWRRRYHPVRDGFSQAYTVSFRFNKEDEKFVDYYTNAWRWAWEVLQPQVNPQDIEAARRSLIDMLAEQVETHGGITGIANMTSFANAGKELPSRRKTIMGFAGKTLESANFLLQDADRDTRPKAKEHRQKGLAIIDSYLQLKLNPPEGIGYWLNNGKPAAGVQNQLFLRYFGDGLKALLKAAKREKEQGREHPEWIVWAQSFADWLLPQQSEEGGFPRAWEPVSGKVADVSPKSTYTVIPYLILLSEFTGEEKYKKAAIKAGEFCWNNGQSEGIFVGGTVDNPDVVDKEAGTLSLEAYLELYDATQNKKWLDRAKVAANFSETWMYIWNVPMPEDEKNADLHWKKGISTIGLQLISTGHSLVDAYMAFDVDEYAKLAVLTGDGHYTEVAKILLHNTKGMLGLSGRIYDLPGPGWQQEHWSLAPERGLGRKRAWLPWVSTSHLNGIFGLEEYDRELHKKLVGTDF